MAFVITNGSLYIKVGSDNRVVTTKNLDSARVFDNKVKAQNVCVCLPTTYKNLGFYVAETDFTREPDVGDDGRIAYAIRQTPTEDTTLTKPADNLDELFLDMNYILGEIKRFEEFVRAFRAQEVALRQQQLYTEAQIFDIEHAAEFTKLNAVQGFKLYRLLRDARVQRRQCKDALAVLALLKDSVTDTIASSRISQEIKHMPHRSFVPRALPELFRKEETHGENS